VADVTYTHPFPFSHEHDDWRMRAVCRGADPRLFDGDRIGDETLEARNARLVAARRAYCDRCPVTAECEAAAARAGDYGTLRAGKCSMTRPNAGVPANRLSQIRSMAGRHYTDREIGDVVGWHYETVRRVRQRNGIAAGRPAHRPTRGAAL
jgi:hypothetical protein